MTVFVAVASIRDRRRGLRSGAADENESKPGDARHT